ncbi:MAG: glycerol-3-phosphate acyltransferase [Dehalococcoidales bacterium]|nr:MAG: glycerol-3-phosphate acyltransferase [Dehalococcoidales bacterium]
MNEIVGSIIAIVVAYLLGSLPFAYIITRKIKGEDIREVGTRNMGAMNTIYSVGFRWGLLVLFLDMAKGAVAILIARWIDTPEYIELAAGGVAVIGHMFPVFLKFKGGKGGATVVGVLALLLPRAIPLAVGIFILALLLTRFPTFSYALALLCAPFVAWLGYGDGILVLFSALLLLMVLIRYMPRLLEMRSSVGNWKRVFIRKGLKDRF